MTTHTFITDCSALDSKYREVVPQDDHTHLYYGLFSVGFKVSGICTPRWPHTPLLRTVQRWIQSIGKLYPQMTTHTPLLRTVQRWIQSIGKLYPQMTTHTFITDCSALDSKYREVVPPDDHTHTFITDCSALDSKYREVVPPDDHTHLYYGLFSVGFKVSGSWTPRWPHTPLLRTVQRCIQSIGKLYPQMTTHTPLLRTVQRWIQSIGKLYPQMTTHTFITDRSALDSKYREVVPPDDHTHL